LFVFLTLTKEGADRRINRYINNARPYNQGAE